MQIKTTTKLILFALGAMILSGRMIFPHRGYGHSGYYSQRGQQAYGYQGNHPPPPAYGPDPGNYGYGN
ncbi:hypothetical protein HF285_08395 [Acidithiobacillus ferrooxidans F221]|uniref:hypothetical protein n=1 Tax=Acidithiobacillus ferrooxidans TaxID=920 RepID=UPI001C076787|nr:hypothetical protein [Acidithiobacillus ferrooxidans]MBU2808274.1 hypothetical protein [Acidithiobacillus ferrooxidans F221]